MEKEEIILNRIDNIETNAIVNNTCMDMRFKRLEDKIKEFEDTKHEFSTLCKAIKDKTITREMLIAYANSYIESQNLKL